jgi:dihydroorotate dehydrogenase
VKDAYRLVRPLLFRLDAERAHELTFAFAGALRRLPGFGSEPPPGLAREVMGLRFRSPLGLAAGLDKDARLLPLWRDLGFGFVEIGTVTPRPQSGNPRPRLYRLPEAGLILNRMGFNSEGAEAVARRLERRPAGLVVGGNVGKNRDTPEEDALRDYEGAYERIAPLVDYAVLNVSSPNTPGLRRLQAPESLARLLEGMLALRDRLELGRQPLLVKLAPDLADEELDATVDAALAAGVSGIVATNTTVDIGLVPEAHRTAVAAWGAGGLSGLPLRDRADKVRRRILERLDARIPLVACGGLTTPADVVAALDEGAALAQVYSALVFEGPSLVRRVNTALNAVVSIGNNESNPPPAVEAFGPKKPGIGPKTMD